MRPNRYQKGPAIHGMPFAISHDLRIIPPLRFDPDLNERPAVFV